MVSVSSGVEAPGSHAYYRLSAVHKAILEQKKFDSLYKQPNLLKREFSLRQFLHSINLHFQCAVSPAVITQSLRVKSEILSKNLIQRLSQHCGYY